LVSLRSGVKRRNLQHSTQAVLFFSPDFDRSLHPFAGQYSYPRARPSSLNLCGIE
jgi:hypothetical protein